jgi:hypothetical protein
VIVDIGILTTLCGTGTITVADWSVTAPLAMVTGIETWTFMFMAGMTTAMLLPA